jgi:hypothetical protein
LFCSASAFGYFLIPVADCLLGYCLTLSLIAALYLETCLDFRMALLIPSILSVLPLIRISALTSSISTGIARLWRSNGVRSFDLHGIANSIWAALLILFLLYPLRLLLYFLLNLDRR